MITLVAESKDYPNSKQYVARIVGRDKRFTFSREFVGSKSGRTTTAHIDEPGIYEVCDIDRKGRKEPDYRVVLARPPAFPPLGTADPDLLNFPASIEEAMTIAKRLDGGEPIVEMIEIYLEETPGKRSYQFRLLTKGEARRASIAVTIDSAVEACWSVLQSLPEREAKKVLAALKVRVSPPKPEPTVEPITEAAT
jgi:hypothetical protein